MAAHPSYPNPLERAIEASRSLISVPQDWDDEGAPPCDESAWERGVAFLRSHAQAATRFGESLPVPRILPGPDGSLDLHWRLGNFEILLNFPTDPRQPASFYGDDRGKSSIRGTILDSSGEATLLPWLLKP